VAVIPQQSPLDSDDTGNVTPLSHGESRHTMTFKAELFLGLREFKGVGSNYPHGVGSYIYIFICIYIYINKSLNIEIIIILLTSA